MDTAFQTIAILGLCSDPRVAEPMRTLAGHLTENGIDVIALPGAANELGVRAVEPALQAHRKGCFEP